MSDQLAAAAQAMGVPESIIERSARARATATGQSYEDVIAAWAGGETIAAAPPPSEPATTDSAPEPDTAPSEPTAPTPAAPAEPTAAPAEPIAAAAVTRAPAPARVSTEEAHEYPVVVTVPTAGIKERTGFSMPAWLGMMLLIIPAFGLIHLALGSGSECGTGTELRVDRVTGLVENCDGSPFEGRGAGGGGTDFIGLGQEQYATCAGCHGPQGAGSGAFPALTGVLNTFGSCADHIEWVTVGSAGFAGGTYGDAGKPVAGGMPGFGSSLSAEQLASVVAFERVRFGGGNPDEVLVDCGLVEGEDGEDGADTEDGAVTDTTTGAEATASH